ncbi:unnamed protein product [Brassica napus]|uniref:(rape) hypothetical protein n=1 Tax=Brassica napus TaxID=3708 RepID=A0A816YC93_BRANA|nr:unnamed protein product [Brassica napus]
MYLTVEPLQFLRTMQEVIELYLVPCYFGFLIQEGTATTLLQGSIFVHRLNTFKHMLKEGAVYKLSRFDVT